MANTHYLALFATAGRPVTHEQRLLMEMLYYLDDRHLQISVNYHSCLPKWIKNHFFFSNLFYLTRLIFSRNSVVLVDFAINAQVMAALLCSRWLQRHRFILIFQDTLCRTTNWALRSWQRFLAWLIFQAADGILVNSRENMADLCCLEKISYKVKVLPSRGGQPVMTAADLSSNPGNPGSAAGRLNPAGWKMAFRQNHTRGLRKRVFDSIFELNHSNRENPGQMAA